MSTVNEILQNTNMSYTYDDLIMMPGIIDFGLDEVDLTSQLTKNIRLKTPIVSSPMDTVTESDMAIQLALHGGLGFIHCNNSIDEQVEHVKRVKRYSNGFIMDPVVLSPETPITQLLEYQRMHDFTSFPITETGKLGSKILGIIAKRDVEFLTNQEIETKQVKDMMNTAITTINEGCTLKEAQDMLVASKLKRLPIISSDGNLVGLVCLKDVVNFYKYPLATRNSHTRQLLVGAAVSTHPHDRTRIDRLIQEAHVDVLVIDAAQGASHYQIQTIQYIKDKIQSLNRQIDIIGGNVVTHEQAQYLLKAGIDGIRVGMGIGCFGAKTPVLMANGSYKAISEINIGEKVINMHGKPVTVVGKTNNGLRNVLKVKFSKWPEPIYVTPNHPFLAATYANPHIRDWISIGALCSNSDYITCMPSEIQGGILSMEKMQESMEVWDIEVDCQSHSFIAANNIVHNSICTTQDVCGVGRGQASAIYNVSQIAHEYGVPVIADGGIASTGSVVKAICLGADVVMMGSMLAGTDESPGEIIYKDNVKLKTYRGMGSKAAANIRTSLANNVKTRYLDNSEKSVFVAQGVSGCVTSKGPIGEYIPYLVKAIKHGFQDVGVKCLTDRENLRRVKMELRSMGAQREGMVHHLYSFEK